MKIGGICTKTDSACTGNWRYATDAEICSFLASGVFGYIGALASDGKFITTCAGIEMYANGSNCSLYHPRQAGECAKYDCESFHTEYREIKERCPASGTNGPGSYCTPNEFYYSYKEVFVCDKDSYYFCVYYLYSEQPEYTENKATIQYNCIATSTYVAGSIRSKVCIKN